MPTKHQSTPANQRPQLERLPSVIGRVGLSRSSILRMVADGRFPRPVRLGTRAVAWRSADVDAWIDQRAIADQTQGDWLG